MRALAFLLVPVAVYVASEVLLTEYRLYIAMVLGLLAAAAMFMRGEARMTKTVLYTLFATSLVFAFEAGYFSRFWFLLYLVPVYLGFVYTPKEAFAYLFGTFVVFIPSIGEVDALFDIFSYASLLVVIPLVMYLRKHYLILRQSTKDILILEEGESRVRDLDAISRLLANRVTNLGVTLRQPLTFVKQSITALLQGDVEAKDQVAYLQRARKRADEALEFIREFEAETSANVVLSSKATKKVKRP